MNKKDSKNIFPITLFGLLDGGELKRQAAEERSYLKEFVPSKDIAEEDLVAIKMVIDLGRKINEATDKGMLSGALWEAQPIDVELLSEAVEKKYINRPMIDLNKLRGIAQWLELTLNCIDERIEIKKNLTNGVKIFRDKINCLDEETKNLINDETQTRQRREEKLLEVVREKLLESFGFSENPRRYELILDALQESSLDETIEKYTKESIEVDYIFLYEIFRDNIKKTNDSIKKMVLIDLEDLRAFMGYLSMFYSNVGVFKDGNSLRASYCASTSKKTEQADKDKILSIATIIALYFLLAGSRESLGGSLMFGVIVFIISFYLIANNKKHKCPECDGYKTTVIAQKNFQGSREQKYIGIEKDKIKDTQGNLQGHVERQVIQSTTINQYEIATYCLACNKIEAYQTEEPEWLSNLKK